MCSICGKNTYNIDWDYIGSGTNHLGCELELEMKSDKRVTKDEPVHTEDGEYVEEGIRREKNWSQKKHEEEVFNQAVFGDSSELTETKIEIRGEDRRKGDRREYPYNSFVRDKQEQIKARGVIKPKKRVKKKFYEDAGDGHMLEVGKLAEEIVDKQEGKWIYESPDGGKTVFRRPFSNYDPKYKEEIDFKTKEPTGRMFTDYPFKDVQIDGC